MTFLFSKLYRFFYTAKFSPVRRKKISNWKILFFQLGKNFFLTGKFSALFLGHFRPFFICVYFSIWKILPPLCWKLQVNCRYDDYQMLCFMNNSLHNVSGQLFPQSPTGRHRGGAVRIEQTKQKQEVYTIFSFFMWFLRLEAWKSKKICNFATFFRTKHCWLNFPYELRPRKRKRAKTKSPLECVLYSVDFTIGDLRLSQACMWYG